MMDSSPISTSFDFNARGNFCPAFCRQIFSRRLARFADVCILNRPTPVPLCRPLSEVERTSACIRQMSEKNRHLLIWINTSRKRASRGLTGLLANRSLGLDIKPIKGNGCEIRLSGGEPGWLKQLWAAQGSFAAAGPMHLQSSRARLAVWQTNANDTSKVSLLCKRQARTR